MLVGRIFENAKLIKKTNIDHGKIFVKFFQPPVGLQKILYTAVSAGIVIAQIGMTKQKCNTLVF